MNLKKRISAILVIAVMAGGLFGAGKAGLLKISPAEEAQKSEESLFGHKDTVYLWYTDEALTDYLNSVAVSYNETKKDVRVIPVYTSGLEYLETINQASLQSESVPDLYIIGNDSLEKAYLAGLASEIKEPKNVPNMRDISEYFPDASIRAVTYHEKQIGYPFYFETSSFLYNKTYLEDWAKAQIEAEADAAEGEAAQEEADNGGEPSQNETDDSGKAAQEEADNRSETQQEETADNSEAIAAKMEEALPKTIDDILSFADMYDAPEQVEAVFKWDVSDIFYNYFFVGNYIDVGGRNGDDEESINIYNESAIRCMRVYQNLNQFFSIDTAEISYDDVLQDFIDGKIVYTVATTDALAKVEEAKKNGEFQYEYGTSVLPDVSEVLLSQSLSVTQTIVVNGYSEHKEVANDFAVYLTCFNSDTLYDRTGKVPALKGVVITNPNVDAFIQEYVKSVPIPKMIETSNYWVELEIAFSQIWDGNDVNQDLKALSEKIKGQIAGEAYTEEYIDVPEEVEVSEEASEEILAENTSEETE